MSKIIDGKKLNTLYTKATPLPDLIGSDIISSTQLYVKAYFGNGYEKSRQNLNSSQ